MVALDPFELVMVNELLSIPLPPFRLDSRVLSVTHCFCRSVPCTVVVVLENVPLMPSCSAPVPPFASAIVRFPVPPLASVI